MTTALNILHKIDSYTFGFVDCIGGMYKAVRHKDPFSFLEWGVEQTEGVSNLTYYVLDGLKYASSIGRVIAEKQFAPLPIFASAAFVATLSGLGIVLNAFALIKESLGVSRQIYFDRAFSEKFTVGDKLEKLSDCKTTQLQRLLPQWLFKDVQGKGGLDYFRSLKDRITDDDKAAKVEAQALIRKIKVSNRKKVDMHIVGIISAICGLVGFIGLLVAFPPALATALIIIGLLLYVVRYVLKKGWVENPEEGFSAKLLLPEFILKRIERKKRDPAIDRLLPYNPTLAIPLDLRMHTIRDDRLFQRTPHRVQQLVERSKIVA